MWVQRPAWMASSPPGASPRVEPVAVSTHRRLRRANLFLVRLWTEQTADDRGAEVWCGKVQRVLDGEAHRFENWQGLVSALVQMVARADRSVEETPRAELDNNSKLPPAPTSREKQSFEEA